jgi:hypothetical protein
MLRKILSLIFNCENTTTMETVSISRPKTDRGRVDITETRSVKSGSGIPLTGDKVQIPDPWDDILM